MLTRRCVARAQRTSALARSVASESSGGGGGSESQAWLGQPHARTHAHLLRPAELAPGLTASAFAARRAALRRALPAHASALVLGGGELLASLDVPHEWRAASDLRYLTGVAEPGAALLLARDATATLFMAERDPAHELWDGARTGVERAAAVFGVEHAASVRALPAAVRGALADGGALRLSAPTCGAAKALERALLETLHALPAAERARVDSAALRAPLDALRVRKSADELALLQRAARVAAAAFKDALRSPLVRSGALERTVGALVDLHCRRRGADRLSFTPVVAGGRNALTIHYVRNDDVLRDGELVLLDAGCEWGGYCSDITRTFPVSATFSEAQRDLYERVLDVEERCIALCDGSALRDNPQSIASLQAKAERWLTEHLLDCGILSGSLDNHVSRRSVTRFYPHNIGHWLGMDVHDTPSIRTNVPLVNDMVITIEPGLYIGAADDVPSRYHNIGIRIEDDIVVRRDKPALVLTSDVPKSISEIEALRAEALASTEHNDDDHNFLL